MSRLKLAGAALAFAINALSPSADSFARSVNSEKPIYFSIDLDGTIFDTIKDKRQVDVLENLVEASDGLHQPVFGATAFIQSLIDMPNAKIVFYSGGDVERNKTLLSQIVLKDGKTAWDHAYKVLSKEDLTPISEPPAGKTRNSASHKKDLRKIAPGIDLTRVIHVDNVPDYVLPGQEKNVIAIDPAYDHVGNYGKLLENQRQGMVLGNPPPSRNHWAYDTQRLIYARGVIEEAIDLTHRREDINIRDAITRLQEGNDPKRFFNAGKKVLSRYHLDHTRFASEAKCPGLINQLAQSLAK